MREIAITRQLPVSASDAFSWLTDYTPDDSSIFGDPPGGRSVERISENEFRLRNRYPGTNIVEETHVVLSPPHQWNCSGVLRYHSFRIAVYSQHMELSPAPKGCELHMTVDLEVTSLLARLYLFFSPDFVSKEINSHYDRIISSLERDVTGRA